MSTARTGVSSQPPKVIIQPTKKKKDNGQDFKISGAEIAKILPTFTDEQKKYIKCWDNEFYRRYSPGEGLVDVFLEAAEPTKGCTLIDWGLVQAGRHWNLASAALT